MKVYVDPDICTGCELCVGTCPEVFEMKGMVSVAKVNPVPPELEASAREAAESCPVEAAILVAQSLNEGVSKDTGVAGIRHNCLQCHVPQSTAELF